MLATRFATTHDDDDEDCKRRTSFRNASLLCAAVAQNCQHDIMNQKRPARTPCVSIRSIDRTTISTGHRFALKSRTLSVTSAKHRTNRENVRDSRLPKVQKVRVLGAGESDFRSPNGKNPCGTCIFPRTSLPPTRVLTISLQLTEH